MTILGSPPPSKPLLCRLGLGEVVKAGGGEEGIRMSFRSPLRQPARGHITCDQAIFFFFWRQKKKTWWRVRGHTSGASHSSTFYPKLIAILIYLKLLIKSLLTYHSCFWIFNCFLTLSLPQVSKIKFRQNSKFHQLYMLRWEQIVLCGVSFERSHNRIN